MGETMDNFTEFTLPRGSTLTLARWLSLCYRLLPASLIAQDQFARATDVINGDPNLKNFVKQFILTPGNYSITGLPTRSSD